MKNKIKLFQTVADLHAKGKVELTAAEKSLIEQETADLIRKSQHYRMAAKAPEGFSELLLDLAKMDADEAYGRVLEFLEESGVEVETEEDEKKEEMEEGGEEKDEKDDEGEDEDKEDEKEEMKEEKEEEKEEKEEKGEEKEEMGEEKGEMGEKKMPFNFEDKDEKRKELIAQSMEMEKCKLAPDKGPENRKRKMKEMEDEDKQGQDMTDIGMTPAVNSPNMQASRSKKIRVRITSSRNIVAVHEDRGPLFHAVPREDVKKDLNALKRLANKVYGLIVYEGAEVAARKCGARLLAGTDEDIETTGGDIPAETGGVTEEADFDSQETPDNISMSDEVMDDAEFDTQETPDKVEAKRQVARYKKISGVEDDADVVTEEKPDPRPDSSSNEADTDAQESADSPPKDTFEGAEFDAKSVEASYKKLYQSRAQKMAENANKDFVKKFSKALEVASLRMLNNMDENPLKIAACDVLTSDNVAFSNGEIYNPMDAGTATELIELFSGEGHTAFVQRLLEKTADLMEKTPEYLNDVYEDIKTLQPLSVQVDESPRVSHRTSRRVIAERNAAYEGNVGVPLVSAGSAPARSFNVKDAIGSTKVTRRLGSVGR